MIKQRVIGGTVLSLLALVLMPYVLNHSNQPAMVHSSPMLQSDSLAKRGQAAAPYYYAVRCSSGG